MPKISFLVTYYNQEQYVSQSIDSILAIDFPYGCEYEILVGDDGSSDKTVDEVKKYIEKYSDKIKLFVMPREKDIKYNSILRASANRLNLLDNASGDYFCILDGDDWYCDKEWITSALNVMENDKSVSVCAFNFQFVTDGICEENKLSLSEGKIPACAYLPCKYTHAGACLLRLVYKREQISDFKQTGYFDDNNIVISNLNNGDLYYINKVIYSYRQTGKSIWTSISEYEQNVINAIDYDINLKYGSKYPEEIKQRHFNGLYFIWKNRNKIYSELGKEKFDKYVSMSKNIENSLFYKIINFDTLPEPEQKEIKDFFHISQTHKIKTLLKKILIKIYKIFIRSK